VDEDPYEEEMEEQIYMKSEGERHGGIFAFLITPSPPPSSPPSHGAAAAADAGRQWQQGDLEFVRNDGYNDSEHGDEDVDNGPSNSVEANLTVNLLSINQNQTSIDSLKVNALGQAVVVLDAVSIINASNPSEASVGMGEVLRKLIFAVHAVVENVDDTTDLLGSATVANVSETNCLAFLLRMLKLVSLLVYALF
jgi:hypothetical protein